MKHHDIPADRRAVHQFCFVGNTDPVLDPENEVAPGKAWFDTDRDQLKYRNDSNTAWAFIGAATEEV